MRKICCISKDKRDMWFVMKTSKTINCKEYAQGFNFWLKRLNDNGNTNLQNESSVSKY